MSEKFINEMRKEEVNEQRDESSEEEEIEINRNSSRKKVKFAIDKRVSFGKQDD